MIGDQIRDKDAVSAVALICEMAAYEREKGRSLYQKMIDLYIEYGFYLEDLISITKKGMDGARQIAAMMEDFRNNPPKLIDGQPVVELLDYEKRLGRNLATDKTWEIKLPKSNVLQFILGDKTKISARPSGTEPKIKFYFSVNGKLENPDEFDSVQFKLKEKIQRIIKEMKL
jgi:phosphoglucomutase